MKAIIQAILCCILSGQSFSQTSKQAVPICIPCDSSNLFGNPRSYEMGASTNEDGVETFYLEEKYDGLEDIPESSAEYKRLADSILLSIAKWYTKRFADSCSVIKIQQKPDAALDAIKYRAEITLHLPEGIQYRIGMDFDSSMNEDYKNFKKIDPKMLFGQVINCCKALEIAKTDKIEPVANIESINLIHLPLYGINIDDDNAALVWVVYGKRTQSKNGKLKRKEMYIDFFSGKVLKRATIEIPMPKIIQDMF